MAIRINDPKIGSVVRHTGWRFENDSNYPCDVLITDGKYFSNGRLSNYWYWRRILPDGSLSDTESGYGSFEETTEEYKIDTQVNVVLNN